MIATGSQIPQRRADANSLASPAQPDWLGAIRDAITKKVTPEMVGKMIDAQVEKAAKGDAKALKLVIELATKMQAASPQPVNATQNVFHVTLPAGTTEADATADPLRMKVYAVLEAMGPLTTGQIAANIGAEESDVDAALIRGEWFETRGSRGKDGPLWSIRKGGR